MEPELMTTFDFAEPPDIGFSLAQVGFNRKVIYTVTGSRPHTTRDGRDITIIEWAFHCAVCGERTETTSPLSRQSGLTRRCRPCIDEAAKSKAGGLTEPSVAGLAIPPDASGADIDKVLSALTKLTEERKAQRLAEEAASKVVPFQPRPQAQPQGYDPISYDEKELGAILDGMTRYKSEDEWYEMDQALLRDHGLEAEHCLMPVGTRNILYGLARERWLAKCEAGKTDE